VGLLTRGLLVIAVFAGLLVLGLYYFSSSCTVGFARSAASVTASGIDATGWCSQQVRGNTDAYAADERKNDILVCRYTIGDLTYIVRDQGALLLGTAACDNLKTLSAGGRIGAPTPILVPR
jgi:hypothetical protein